MRDTDIVIGGYYRDQHGHIVQVSSYEDISQRVIYRRPRYDWECASPLILFRSRFTRVEK